MNLQMTRKKPSTTTVSATGQEAEIARLVRQIATLKREIAKLQVFRASAGLLGKARAASKATPVAKNTKIIPITPGR